MFMRARQRADGQRAFDVVIAMYHDQGLIPVKYLGVEQGVNVTLGLPLIRTSPDHGTAMDLTAGAFQPLFLRLSRISRSSKTSSGVMGAAAGATGSGLAAVSRFIWRIITKMMKAKMTKFSATVRKLP